MFRSESNKEHKVPLFDSKKKKAIEKYFEKNPSTKYIENYMLLYKQVYKHYDEMSKERTCYFISVDFSNVIKTHKDYAV